jgi:hypothetical protein
MINNIEQAFFIGPGHLAATISPPPPRRHRLAAGQLAATDSPRDNSPPTVSPPQSDNFNTLTV